MPYHVALTDEALKDVDAIAQFYIDIGNLVLAEQILNTIDAAASSLAEQPNRGHTPHELYGMGRIEELEIIVGIYRIIYLVRAQTIYVIAVFDGRQNVKKHLQERRSGLANN